MGQKNEMASFRAIVEIGRRICDHQAAQKVNQTPWADSPTGENSISKKAVQGEMGEGYLPY